jgi:hypothetical protein
MLCLYKLAAEGGSLFSDDIEKAWSCFIFFPLLIIVVVIIIKNSNLSTDGMEEGLGSKALIVILLPKKQKKILQ